KDEGSFIAKATSASVAGSATFAIAKTETATSSTPATTPPDTTGKLSWSGEVPTQKWMNFYTKVLARFARDRGLKLNVTVEVAPEGGLSKQSIEETKVALRELGLNDDVKAS
ncbi:MAG: AAA family ATPase, partial [Candidatus Lindowbacteria bacterium]|nr:AAA family ATPase [Candidatus Lindowbacteria bacterium]